MGFSSGGDDYLPKPFSYQELISRVKALVRRYHVYQGSGRRTQEEKYAAELWKCIRKPELYGKRKRDFSDRYGVFHSLYPYEAQKADFSVEHLYEAVWEETYYYGAANIVMVHIRNLRSK